MANVIKGNHDGKNGRNETYQIPGRGNKISRQQLVKEVDAGKHKDFHTVKINGEKFIQGNPDSFKKNNVNE